MTGSKHQIVAHLIKAIRIEAGLKQIEVSQRLGVTQSIVSKFESGERRLDLLEIRSICVICSVSLADFVARVEQRIWEISHARR